MKANYSFSFTFYTTNSLDYNLLVISCVGKERHLEGSLPLRCLGGPVFFFPAAVPWGKEDGSLRVCGGGWGQRGRRLITFATGQASP